VLKVAHPEKKTGMNGMQNMKTCQEKMRSCFNGRPARITGCIVAIPE
jgi:hypothetical protein